MNYFALGKRPSVGRPLIGSRGTGRSLANVGARFLGALVIAFSLASCGEQQRREEPRPSPGQTIARVNGQEITKHELEAEMQDLGPLRPGEEAATTNEVLRRIVQRTLLAQKAVEKGLHRTPEVMTELRRKEATVLARAYLVDNLANQLPVSKYDVEDFIDANPHYFTGRKHYIFDQVVIGNDQFTDEVREALTDLTTLEAVEDALIGMDVMYTRRLNANLGSQFPKQTVVQIDALEPGELFLSETRENALVSRLIESRLQPMTGDEARETARRVLAARRDAAASYKLVEGLLAGATVELLGEFSDTPLFPAGPGGTGAAEEKEGEGETETGSETDAASQPSGDGFQQTGAKVGRSVLPD